MRAPITMAEIMYRAIAILSLGENETSNFEVEQVKRVIIDRMRKQPDASRVERVAERMMRDDITGRL